MTTDGGTSIGRAVAGDEEPLSDTHRPRVPQLPKTGTSACWSSTSPSRATSASTSPWRFFSSRCFESGR